MTHDWVCARRHLWVCTRCRSITGGSSLPSPDLPVGRMSCDEVIAQEVLGS